MRAVVLLFAALLMATPVGAGLGAPLEATLLSASDPAGRDEIVSEPYTIVSFDGTQLAALLWFNASWAATPRPVVLAAHGWSQDMSVMESSARWLADLGYVVLAWDARGFGASGGAVGLNGPEEWRDVSVLVDWLAARG